MCFMQITNLGHLVAYIECSKFINVKNKFMFQHASCELGGIFFIKFSYAYECKCDPVILAFQNKFSVEI